MWRASSPRSRSRRYGNVPGDNRLRDTHLDQWPFRSLWLTSTSSPCLSYSSTYPSSWGSGRNSQRERQVNFLYSLAIWLVDTTGVLGFVVAMLALTKLNHYANFSTSGRWTTVWLLASTMVPFSWKLMDLVEWGSNLLGSEFSNPLPAWNYAWFLFLGVASFVVMVAFTLLYQRSFRYAITDKRIHISKFLYFDTSVHGISFQKVENLKADPTVWRRIFGFRQRTHRHWLRRGPPGRFTGG